MFTAPLRTRAALLAALALTAPASQAQFTFSIDTSGPHEGGTDCAGVTPIKEGDILTPCTGTGIPGPGPLPSPLIRIPAGPGGLGLFVSCVPGTPAPGMGCRVELDALSYGLDGLITPVDYSAGKVVFSVDAFASGVASLPSPPSVGSEGPVGDAASDMFMDLGLSFASTFPLPAVFVGNRGTVDGDGLMSTAGFAYPGSGLVEPAAAVPAPNPGDNLDAGDLESVSASSGWPAGGVYYSLDAALLDPLTGATGQGTGFGYGFTGADVLHTATPGGGPALYASAAQLGLDLAGVGTDDLDALALNENGLPGFQPALQPFDWTAPNRDMLLFSVRRGSAVIGMPDSLSGLPIEEGDVLTVPLPTTAGGVSPFPAIFIPAEQLGLATVRSGSPNAFGLGDDMDALDTMQAQPQLIANSSCFCPQGPCGNSDPAAGCANSTGVGGLLTATGTSSVGADNLVLTATQLPLFQNGLFYMGSTVVYNFFYDGIQCALGQSYRFLNTIQNSGASGTMTGTNWVFWSSGLIVPGSTWTFQCWYRDVPGTPCLTGANLTNGVTVLFTP